MTLWKPQLDVDYSMIPVLWKDKGNWILRENSLENHIKTIQDTIWGEGWLVTANVWNLKWNLIEQYKQDSKVIASAWVPWTYNLPENKLAGLFPDKKYSKEDLVKYSLDEIFKNSSENWWEIASILGIKWNTIDNEKWVDYSTYKHVERIAKSLDDLWLDKIKIGLALYGSEFKGHKALIKSLLGGTTKDKLSDKKLEEQLQKVEKFNERFWDKIDRYVTQNINSPEAAKKLINAMNDITDKKLFLWVWNTDNKSYANKALKSTLIWKISEEEWIKWKIEKLVKMPFDKVSGDMVTRLKESFNDEPNVFGESIKWLWKKAKNAHLHLNWFWWSIEKTQEMVSKALKAKKKELES